MKLTNTSLFPFQSTVCQQEEQNRHLHLPFQGGYHGCQEGLLQGPSL
jgi:hypothetical protein